MIVMNNATRPNAKANTPANANAGFEKNSTRIAIPIIANPTMKVTIRIGPMIHEKMICAMLLIHRHKKLAI